MVDIVGRAVARLLRFLFVTAFACLLYGQRGIEPEYRKKTEDKLVRAGSKLLLVYVIVLFVVIPALYFSVVNLRKLFSGP
jgi:hypothetical protein